MTLGSKAGTVCQHIRSAEVRWEGLTEGSCRIAISPITTGAVVAAVVVTAIVIVVTAVVVIATGLGVVAAVAPGLIVLVTSRISDRKVGVRSLGRLT